MLYLNFWRRFIFWINDEKAMHNLLTSLWTQWLKSLLRKNQRNLMISQLPTDYRFYQFYLTWHGSTRLHSLTSGIAPSLRARVRCIFCIVQTSWSNAPVKSTMASTLPPSRCLMSWNTGDFCTFFLLARALSQGVKKFSYHKLSQFLWVLVF